MTRFTDFLDNHDKCCRALMIAFLPIAIPVALFWGLVDLWEAFWSEWEMSKYGAAHRRFTAERDKALLGK